MVSSAEIVAASAQGYRVAAGGEEVRKLMIATLMTSNGTCNRAAAEAEKVF